MNHILKGAVFLAIAQGAWAAHISGVVDFSASFSTGSTALTFVAGGSNFSTMIDLGTASGPNATYGTVAAAATNFTTNFSATSQVDVSAGTGSSIFNVKAEAISGTVRISNLGGVQANYSINQNLLYSLVSTGPGTEGFGVAAAIERYNTGTSVWDIIGILSFGLSDDESNSACTPACMGFSGYNIAGNSVADIRLHTTLQGFVSQPAGPPPIVTPEPASMGLMAAGLGALILGARRRK